MTRVRIRVDDEVTDELLSAFPQLSPTVQRAQTTLTGDVADQEELQGVLNFLNSMGVTIVDVVTIPD
jgi:antitoxin component of RelBE/YafQ-DinJ toxin-antitoxin module